MAIFPHICVECKTEMLCHKNNVPVIHYTNNEEALGIDCWCNADIWECPVCGKQITSGHGEMQLDGEPGDGVEFMR